LHKPVLTGSFYAASQGGVAGREKFPAVRDRQYLPRVASDRIGSWAREKRLGGHRRWFAGMSLSMVSYRKMAVVKSTKTLTLIVDDPDAPDSAAFRANRSCTITSDRASWPPFGMAGFTVVPKAIMKPATW